MVEGGLKLDRCLIAVGNLGPAATDDLARLADQYEIRVAGCEDSYSAVVELAVRPGHSTLVVGPLAELTRENCVFFSIAARNGARCCCLRTAASPPDHEEVVAAIRAGAYVVSGNGDLAGAIEDWLTADKRPADGRRMDRGPEGDEEFRTTTAELTALLWPEMDD